MYGEVRRIGNAMITASALLAFGCSQSTHTSTTSPNENAPHSTSHDRQPPTSGAPAQNGDIVGASTQDTAAEGKQPLFVGKRAYTFAVKFKIGKHLDEDTAEAKTLKEGIANFPKIPIQGEYFNVSQSVSAGKHIVEASNDIWLTGDGDSVKMNDAILWNKGVEPIEFTLSYFDTVAVVSAKFTGAFSSDGTLIGRMIGHAMIVDLFENKIDAVGEVSDGEFSLKPAADAEKRGPEN